MVRPWLFDTNNDEVERYAVYRFYGTFSIAVLSLFEARSHQKRIKKPRKIKENRAKRPRSRRFQGDFHTFSSSIRLRVEVFFANWSPACRILTDNVTEWYS